MMSHLDSLPRDEGYRSYSSVVYAILDSIAAEGLVPGDVLPPERKLAGQLQVSRGSLREALRVLQHAGVLDIRPSSGIYLVDGGSRSALLRAQAEAVGEHSPLDLIVARASVEPTCAQHAALAHHSGDVTAMRDALEEQTAKTLAGENAARADSDFHLAVAEATHNGVLIAMERTLVSLMQEQMWTDLKRRSRARVGEEYLEHHRLIFQAIEQRDAHRASRLMLMHISAIEVGLLAELEHSASAEAETRG